MYSGGGWRQGFFVRMCVGADGTDKWPEFLVIFEFGGSEG